MIEHLEGRASDNTPKEYYDTQEDESMGESYARTGSRDGASDRASAVLQVLEGSITLRA